jgi:hypothetical protein
MARTNGSETDKAKENGMKNCKAPKNQITRRILLSACATALAVACMVALPQPAHADDVTPPPVPADIEVPPGNTAFFVGHGVGTQNYICLPSSSGFAFRLFTPQATLFNDDHEQLTTHYFSPNLSPIPPEKLNTIRVTWQHSQDTSTVWGKVIQSSSDRRCAAKDAIACLLVEVVGAQDGPSGGNTLSDTTFIQRLNTQGGVAPSQDCASSADVGKQAFVPYKADYFFYK